MILKRRTLEVFNADTLASILMLNSEDRFQTDFVSAGIKSICFHQGPLASQLFSGSVDQSYIPHAIAYAACLGEHNQRCNGGPDNYSASDPGPAACSAPAPESNPGVVRGGVVVASSVMADDSATPHAAATSRYSTRSYAMCAMVLLLISVVSYGFEVT
jgi:hypothetical protein